MHRYVCLYSIVAMCSLTAGRAIGEEVAPIERLQELIAEGAQRIGKVADVPVGFRLSKEVESGTPEERQQILEQVLLWAGDKDNEQRRNVGDYLAEFLPFRDEDRVIVGCRHAFDADRTRSRASQRLVKRVHGEVSRGYGGNFGAFEEVMDRLPKESVDRVAIARYIFSVSPTNGLLVHLDMLPAIQERVDLELIARRIDLALWKKSKGKQDADLERCSVELQALAEHREWFVRGYVAVVMAASREMRQAEKLKKLEEDDNAVVRWCATLGRG